jgi:hypothetical protein
MEQVQDGNIQACPNQVLYSTYVVSSCYAQ